MINYEKIAEINNLLKYVKIGDKKYAEVKERIRGFRILCPDGFIDTKVELLDEGVAMARTEVGEYQDGRRVVLATGTAMEEKESSRINNTAFIENCETSAVGRALGMLGLGIETAVASAEEMVKVNKASQRQKDAILRNYRDDEGGIMDLLDALGIGELDAMNHSDASVIMDYMKKNGWKPLTMQQLGELRRRKK